MINRPRLLADLKPLLKAIEADLRTRCDEVHEIHAGLKKEYDQARAAGRTGATFEQWRAALTTQVAVAWVLSCVFVRFLEDNGLISPPRISGALHDHGSGGLGRARDERETYFRGHPKQTDRDYLLAVFDDLARLPGTKDVFGSHNPALSAAYRGWLSGDATQTLIEFFQKIDADGTGEIVHDFTDPAWDTRFLGDLYQDLSEAARKKYALLQTPEFVEEFILDRTLEPAIEEFGLGSWSFVLGSSSEHPLPTTKNQEQKTNNCFKMIDPACGSGHFLLGSFARILKHWRAKEPGTNDRELVNRALASVHGVDLNPYAVAIARFRLLLAAMRECGIARLADAPGFKFNLACGDALLHGEGAPGTFGFDEYHHVYQVEDREELTRILRPGRYHAVAANPPYITPKDKALNKLYRKRYSTCHRQYALTVPFMQRLFQLAVSGYGGSGQGGYVGQITSNSFMKREFGKKLIEQYLAGHDGGPGVDLTHVIDTSGAYIPGHGTPTVILFGRNQPAVMKTIRTVMGIRGEPSTPADPARGHVWSAIVDQIDRPGSQSDFVSVADSPRALFCKHPWSIGGGGAAELKEQLDSHSETSLGQLTDSIGITSFTLEDDVFILPEAAALRRRMAASDFRTMIIGDAVRDWVEAQCDVAVFPYDAMFLPVPEQPAHPVFRYLWFARSCLANNKMFGGKSKVEEGLKWYEYGRLTAHKLHTPLSIVFAFVATHNHFVLDRGGKVFNRSAPVIKLPAEATEDDHLALLGLLNSSTACFWMKQVFHDKGSSVDSHGARQTTIAFENFREFTATGLLQFPLPTGRPTELARRLDQLAQQLQSQNPDAILTQRRQDAKKHREHQDLCALAPLREALTAARRRFEELHWQMIALQEELDWECYGLYQLLPASCLRAFVFENPPSLDLGQRAFEIVLARRMARGEVQSTWFTRHGSTPRTELPDHWPAEYRRLVEQRIELIETDLQIGLIEQPEYKRRWNTEPWDVQLQRALREWLLDRLESYFDFDGRMGGEGQRGRGTEGQREKHSAPLPLCHFAPPPCHFAPPPCHFATGSVTTVARLADLARADRDFMQVAEIFTGRMDFDVGALVGELVAAESVPALPVLRHKPSGMDKRAAWERTWELQREEDQRGKGAEGQSEEHSGPLPLSHSAPLLDIPVPPKYKSADFQNSNYWRLRGKLDVPKERWVSFPHCEGEDGTLVIAWAGYDHLQLARAIAERYELAKEQEGRKLVPLLAAIGQLIPWLKQWHNDLDPAFGTRMGDYFENHLAEEAKELDMTVEQVMAWTPEKRGAKGQRGKGAEGQRGKGGGE